MLRKQIQDFGDYEICLNGDVYSYKNRLCIKLKPCKAGADYRKVTLRKNNKAYHKYIHRLVAEHFISNPKNKPQINHKNGIKTDNRAENLEWCTHSENQRHRHDVLKANTTKKLNSLQISIIKRLMNIIPQHEIAKYFNVVQQTISNINTGIFYDKHEYGKWESELNKIQ